jgi:hypothetical protein
MELVPLLFVCDLDQPFSNFSKEIFAFCAGFRHDIGVVSMLQRDVLQCDIHRVFGLVSNLQQFPYPVDEWRFFGSVDDRCERGWATLTCVLVKSGFCQAIIGASGFGVAQEGRDGKFPRTNRTTPCGIIRVVDPDQSSHQFNQPADDYLIIRQNNSIAQRAPVARGSRRKDTWTVFDLRFFTLSTGS